MSTKKKTKKKNSRMLSNKTIFILILTVFVVAATVLAFVVGSSEEDNTDKKITVGGLDFVIPEYMARGVDADGVLYKYEIKDENDPSIKTLVATFCALYQTPERVADLLPENATAKDYADIVAKVQKAVDYKVDYDSEKQRAVLAYSDTEYYYLDVILLNEGLFHHVKMKCILEKREEFEPELKKWSDSIKINSGKLTRYNEGGLEFALPSYMAETYVNYADVSYGNLVDRTEFFVYFYSKEALATTPMYLDKTATVKEYADWFIEANSYVNVNETYDEESRTIVLEYVYNDNTYYCDYIARNDDALFHVTLCCDANLVDKYKPIFAEWMSNISIPD